MFFPTGLPITNQAQNEEDKVRLIKKIKFDHINRSINNIGKIFKITNNLSDELVVKEVL